MSGTQANEREIWPSESTDKQNDHFRLLIMDIPSGCLDVYCILMATSYTLVGMREHAISLIIPTTEQHSHVASHSLPVKINFNPFHARSHCDSIETLWNVCAV